jgi:hypothetical protein
VLACRIASILAQHEPGWRLPRPSVLARRFGVSPEAASTAIDDLLARHLVRQRPDGQLCRTSPAEYHLPLPAGQGLQVQVEPARGVLACRSRSVSIQPLREDVARSLGTAAGETGCVLRLQWTVDEEPAGVSTTYAAASLGELVASVAESANPAVLPLAGVSRLLQLGQQQPAPGLASMLRLAAIEPATVLTAGLSEPGRTGLSALTVAVLRPELFRVTVQSAQVPLPGPAGPGYGAGWAHVDVPWEI